MFFEWVLIKGVDSIRACARAQLVRRLTGFHEAHNSAAQHHDSEGVREVVDLRHVCPGRQRCSIHLSLGSLESYWSVCECQRGRRCKGQARLRMQPGRYATPCYYARSSNHEDRYFGGGKLTKKPSPCLPARKTAIAEKTAVFFCCYTSSLTGSSPVRRRNVRKVSAHAHAQPSRRIVYCVRADNTYTIAFHARAHRYIYLNTTIPVF